MFVTRNSILLLIVTTKISYLFFKETVSCLMFITSGHMLVYVDTEVRVNKTPEDMPYSWAR